MLFPARLTSSTICVVFRPKLSFGPGTGAALSGCPGAMTETIATHTIPALVRRLLVPQFAFGKFEESRCAVVSKKEGRKLVFFPSWSVLHPTAPPEWRPTFELVVQTPAGRATVRVRPGFFNNIQKGDALPIRFRTGRHSRTVQARVIRG